MRMGHDGEVEAVAEARVEAEARVDARTRGWERETEDGDDDAAAATVDR